MVDEATGERRRATKVVRRGLDQRIVTGDARTVERPQYGLFFPASRRNVRAFVAERGAMEGSLLGMTFLETLSSYSVSGDRLELAD